MPTDTLTCPNCSFENAAVAKFCANCGKPLRAACPECGAAIPDGARFCPNCGIPLGARAGAKEEAGPVLTAEARKVVTIIFADLVGSTGLTEHLDPEEARDVVGKFYRVVQHAVERFGGSVANLLGDAVLAVFGLPTAHEDDPERAVRAGLAIKDAMPALNDHLVAAHSVRLAVRVGINTGEVVAASGSAFDRDFLVSDAVTTAARLQQTVAPGMVVVGERTYRLTQDAIAYRELSPLEVKGKTAALAVWEATAPLAERVDVRRIAAPLVGRHGELGILRYLYGRSRDESVVHLITILGHPGVGKSRLLREFLAEVRDSDPAPLVLRGRSVAFGEHIGYQALIDILRAQARLMDTDPPPLVRAKMESWLQECIGTSESLLEGLLLTFGGDAGDPADPGQRRQQLFEAWRALLGALCAQRPVVLAFEDLHWADDGLLDLIEWLSHHVQEVPLLIVCLARPELLERRPTWGGGRRNVSTVDLLPLRAQEAEQLVAALSSQGLGPDVRRMIAQRAEGNPLFVEELVRMLLEGGGPGGSVPDTVQAVLTARIDRLPTGERRVLQAAAVMGRTFWRSAVAPLAGLNGEETAAAINNLIIKELVVQRPQSTIADEQEYAFRHILTRDVAYGMLPRSQRHRAHLQAARWLEARLGERLEEVIEILAEHMRLAGDDVQAARYLLRAASKARRLYANADAIRLYDQAEAAAQKGGLPAHETAGIYLGRGDVQQLMGDYTAAQADFMRGLEVARIAADPMLEAVMESRIGLIHHRQMRLEDAERHFARTAVLAREAGGRAELGLALVDLANVAWDRGQMAHDHPALVEGIDLLRQVGEKSALARGLNLLCMAHFAAGEYDAAVAAASEARAAARGAGDKSREATSLSYLSIINGIYGRYQDSIEQGGAAIALANEIGDRRRHAFATSIIGYAHAALGRWGTGIRLLEESLPLVQEYSKIHLPFPLFFLAVLYLEIGSRERAGILLRAGERLETNHPTWELIALTSSVCLARLAGDHEALNHRLDEVQRTRAWGIFIPDDAGLILPIGEGFIETGRVDELRQFLRDRRQGVEKFGAAPHLAAFDIASAWLHIHDGQPGEAVARLDQALARSESCGDVFTMRRALELRWSVRHDDEDRGALRALLERLSASLPADLRATFENNRRVRGLA